MAPKGIENYELSDGKQEGRKQEAGGKKQGIQHLASTFVFRRDFPEVEHQCAKQADCAADNEHPANSYHIR